MLYIFFLGLLSGAVRNALYYKVSSNIFHFILYVQLYVWVLGFTADMVLLFNFKMSKKTYIF